MLQSIGQDVRYAVRTFRARPGFTAVALATLALGIGANTAIFSAVNAVLLSAPPYGNADRIVVLYETNRRYEFSRGVANPFNYTAWERGSDVFRDLAATYGGRGTLTGAGDPVFLSFQRVTSAFFDVMGVAPIVGRPLNSTDADQDLPVAVISHDLWSSRFDRDPDVIGRAMTVDNEALTIVGVMPATFRYPTSATFWRPFRLSPAVREDLASYFLVVVGRLHDGVTLEQAQTQLSAISARLEEQYPERRAGRGVFVSGLHESLTERVSEGLVLLQGVVGLVLLIACANVANLLLAAASGRQREFAIRAAIGAGRWRITRQVMTESVLLALGGAVLGSMVAVWGVRGLVAIAPAYFLPAGVVVGVDGVTLLFAGSVATATGLAFGMAPALSLISPRLAATLGRTSNAAGGSGAAGSRWLRSTLVGCEVALAVVLLVGSGLLIRSFAALMNQEPGFETPGLLTARIDLPASRYETPAARAQFWSDLYDRLGASSGVQRAGGSTALPFSVWEWQTAFYLEDDPEQRRSSSVRTITDTYFDTLAVPLVAGRAFSAGDREGTDPVLLVNERFAAEFFPGSNPVGQRLRPLDDDWATIVGVVGNIKHLGLDQAPLAELYRPVSQDPPTLQMLAIRTTGVPEAFAADLRATVGELDPLLAVDRVTTMDGLIGGTTAQRQFYLTLLTLFAVLAGALAAIGIYGVMSYVMSLRRGEVGIRMALGARPTQVSGLVIRQGLRPVAVGLGAGLVAAAWLGGVLESQLFGVETIDGVTLVVVSIGLLVVATVACWVPAARAGRVPVVEVMRSQ